MDVMELSAVMRFGGCFNHNKTATAFKLHLIAFYGSHALPVVRVKHDMTVSRRPVAGSAWRKCLKFGPEDLPFYFTRVGPSRGNFAKIRVTDGRFPAKYLHRHGVY